MKASFLMRLLTFSLFCLPFSGHSAVSVVGVEGDYWAPRVTFQVRATQGRFTIPMICPAKDMQDVGVYNSHEFPLLTVDSPDFVGQIKQWLETSELTEGSFVFTGNHEGQEITRSFPYPDLETLKIELVDLMGQPRYEMGRVYIESMMVRVIGTDFNPFDIVRSIEQLSGGYALKLLSTTVLFPNKDLVSRHVNGGPIYEGAEMIRQVYERPKIAGIRRLEDLAGQETSLSVSTGKVSFKKSIASRIILESERAQEEIEYLEVGGEEDDLRSQSVAETFRSGTTLRTSQASSVAGRSVRTVVAAPALEEDPGMQNYYKIEGAPVQVESPYVWSQGGQLFLTKTYEQVCHLLRQDTADLTIPYSLRYTVESPFAVTVKTRDARVSTNVLPNGLYKLKGRKLETIDDSYTKLEKAYTIKKTDPASPEVGEIKTLQTSSHAGTKEVYPYVGILKDFITPDKRTTVDQRTYDDLMADFKRDGFMRTVLSLPPDKQHLIVPFLKWVGDQPNFWLPHDSSFMGVAEYFDETRNSLSIHSYPDKKNQDWAWHMSASPTICCVGVYQFEHLKLIPLFKTDKINIYFNWPAKGRTGTNGWYPKTIPGPGNGLLTEDHWEDLARAVRMNQFKEFNFQVQRVHTKEDGTTPVYTREPDNLFTIKPFADAIRETTVLKSFRVPGWLSLCNLEYLLLYGIAPNHSIRELDIGARYSHPRHLWGATPLMWAAEMLKKNDAIQKLSLEVWDVCDFEALNLLGDALLQNKTLTELSIMIENNSSLFGKQHSTGESLRFLPKRPDDPLCRCLNSFYYVPCSQEEIPKFGRFFHWVKPRPESEHSSCKNLDRFERGVKNKTLQKLTFYWSEGTPTSMMSHPGFNFGTWQPQSSDGAYLRSIMSRLQAYFGAATHGGNLSWNVYGGI